MRFRAKEIARAVAGDLTDESAGDVEITSGLQAGEQVVTYGAYGVEDSAKVIVSGK